MSATPPTTLSNLPDAPDRADRATFSARCTALFDTLKNTSIAEWRALMANVYANAVDAFNSATTAVSNAATATAAAAQAQASAASALGAPGTNATSTTSLTVGTGSKTLTIQAGKAFAIGQHVMLASAAAPALYMIGQITAHNSGTGALTVLVATTNGTGTAADWIVSLAALAGVTTTGTATLSNKTLVAPDELAVALAGNNIDLSLGSVYYKTISGNTTLSVSNLPTSGQVRSFTLEITNGGSAVVTWWAGIAWTAGTPPALTASGLDVLEFYTRDGGATWRGFRSARAVA